MFRKRPGSDEPKDETEPEKPAKTPEDARTLATSRLSVREYSASEMRHYLRRKGFGLEIAEPIVAELLEQGLINDRRYARAVTRTQAIRDKGPGYILSKLRQKGVRIELGEVRDIYADAADRSELDSARKVVERRYPRALESSPRGSRTAEAQAIQKEKQRAFQALLRRGFSQEIARKVLLGGGFEPPPEDA